uniref:Metalloendopeptidase n=1 Tax=Strongyloides papillosus TaxID=174720 RepID=A0A0N5B208_STREA
MILIKILIFLGKLVFSVDLTFSILKNNLSIEREKRAILKRKNYLWKEKVIPYYVNNILNDNIINYALLKISKETCFKFKQTYNPRKALFTYQPGLLYLTDLGKRKEIPHKIYVQKHTMDVGNIIRETMRALGVDYEHNRYDRDHFIFINWKNIKPKFLKFFKKDFKGSTNTFNTSYDYRSVMHFSEDEYGILRKRVITAYNVYMQPFIGKSQSLTFNDAKILNQKYCSYPQITHPDCINFSYQDPKHPSICKCPSFTQGIDCGNLIINNDFCSYHNQLFARKEKHTVFLHVGGNCTFYVLANFGKKIAMKISYYNLRLSKYICKESKSIEIRYRQDLGASGNLFCPGQSTRSILSESHRVIIQSHFPAMEIIVKVKFWEVNS